MPFINMQFTDMSMISIKFYKILNQTVDHVIKWYAFICCFVRQIFQNSLTLYNQVSINDLQRRIRFVQDFR